MPTLLPPCCPRSPGKRRQEMSRDLQVGVSTKPCLPGGMFQLWKRSFPITPQTKTPLRISLLAFPHRCSAAASGDGTRCAPAFQEWKLSLRAGVQEHGETETLGHRAWRP